MDVEFVELFGDRPGQHGKSLNPGSALTPQSGEHREYVTIKLPLISPERERLGASKKLPVAGRKRKSALIRRDHKASRKEELVAVRIATRTLPARGRRSRDGRPKRDALPTLGTRSIAQRQHQPDQVHLPR